MESDPHASRNFAIICFLGLVWGGTFMVVEIALEGYGPITVACARTTLGALALHLVRFAMGAPWPDASRRLWIFLLLIGMFNTAVPFTLLSWAQQYVTSAFTGLTLTLLPLFILPMAYYFADEPLGLRRVAGVLTGFCGALVLIGPSLAGHQADGLLLAELACIAAITSYAASSTMTRVAPPIAPITLAATTMSIGACALIPLMLITEGLPDWAGPRSGGAIILLGLLPTAVAAYLRVLVLRTSGPVFMSLVNYQVPLWAMFFGAVILGESLPGRFFIALILIIAGLIISRWNALRTLLGFKITEPR